LWANLPLGAYEPDEIDLKAGALFAHLYGDGAGGRARAYH
jgi:type I restriction enzyme R subunit